MRKKGWIFVLACICFALACEPRSEYQKLVDTELSRDVHYDSLFAGLSFNMTKKEFFDYCWDQNRKGIFINGVGSMVSYDVSKSFSRPTKADFYPKYVGNTMLEMPVEFQYTDWALWNEETKVELLIEEVKQVLLAWYGGNDFIEMKTPDGSVSVWVKIDGNRQIRVGRKSVSAALVTFTDLAAKEELESNSKS